MSLKLKQRLNGLLKHGSTPSQYLVYCPSMDAFPAVGTPWYAVYVDCSTGASYYWCSDCDSEPKYYRYCDALHIALHRRPYGRKQKAINKCLSRGAINV